MEQASSEQAPPGSAAVVSAADVGHWQAALADVHRRIGHRFARAEMRRRAGAYLRGLLSGVERKNGWQLAEFAGDATPDGMQDFLNRAPWDADAVRDDLQAYVVEHLGDAGAVLVVDETGFLKKGSKSVGVQRQYSGTAGRGENCQVGVFLTYATPRGHTYLDRALYLPGRWTDDRARCQGAGVPDKVAFATKPQLAQQLLARAVDGGVPCAWVTADCVYGADPELRHWLEAAQRPYVLAVRKDTYLAAPHPTGVWRERVQTLAARVPAVSWQRLSAGAGAKGPRWYDWALLPLAEPAPPGWALWLLVRRSLTAPTHLAYYRVFAPTETALGAPVAVAGLRWTVEECLETGKGEVGLDEYEVRRWAGWHRHITLAMLAHAYLTVLRAHAAAAEEVGAKGGTLPPAGRRRHGPTRTLPRCCR
jgi:SRSO17 transposase